MKLLVLLMLCAIAAATPLHNDGVIVVDNVVRHDTDTLQSLPTTTEELLSRLHAFVFGVVENGWPQFEIPPLNPLILDSYHLTVPAGLLNLDLQLKGIFVEGFEKLTIHRCALNMNELSLDMDLGFPTFDVKADQYDLVGDLFTAIPLYGKGRAEFKVDGFRFRAKLYLKQSANRNSVIIDRVENASFTIPSIKSNLDGVIGGGEVDAIVNVMIEEVIISYLNRFRGAIANFTSEIAITVGNPRLEQLDTWKYIASIRH